MIKDNRIDDRNARSSYGVCWSGYLPAIRQQVGQTSGTHQMAHGALVLDWNKREEEKETKLVKHVLGSF